MSRYGIYDEQLGFLPEDDALNITDINENQPHCVSELICVRCRKRWIGVYPETTWLKEIECENCGPGFVIKTGQDLEKNRMSGIYIPNMANPVRCSECDFCTYGYCDLLDRYVTDSAYKDDACPLVPVPAHGRLGDLDVLIDKVITKYLEHERKGELVFAAAEIKQDIVDLISNAPTIIPKEEG